MTICEETAAYREKHALALIIDGGPQSRATGTAALAKIDVGCKAAGGA